MEESKKNVYKIIDDFFEQRISDANEFSLSELLLRDPYFNTNPSYKLDIFKYLTMTIRNCKNTARVNAMKLLILEAINIDGFLDIEKNREAILKYILKPDFYIQNGFKDETKNSELLVILKRKIFLISKLLEKKEFYDSQEYKERIFSYLENIVCKKEDFLSSQDLDFIKAAAKINTEISKLVAMAMLLTFDCYRNDSAYSKKIDDIVNSVAADDLSYKYASIVIISKRDFCLFKNTLNSIKSMADGEADINEERINKILKSINNICISYKFFLIKEFKKIAYQIDNEIIDNAVKKLDLNREFSGYEAENFLEKSVPFSFQEKDKLLMAEKIFEYNTILVDKASQKLINKLFLELRNFENPNIDKNLTYENVSDIINSLEVSDFFCLYKIFYSINEREKIYGYKKNNSAKYNTYEAILNLSSSCSVGTKLKRLVLQNCREIQKLYTKRQLVKILNEAKINQNIDDFDEIEDELNVSISLPFESISKQPVKTILQNPYNFSVLPFNDDLEKLANNFDKLLLERKNLKDLKEKLDQKLEEKGKEILDFIEKNNECSETLTDYFVLDNNLSQVWKIKKIKSNSQAEYICDTIDNILNKETGTEIGTKIVDKLIEKRKKNNLKQIGIEN